MSKISNAHIFLAYSWPATLRVPGSAKTGRRKKRKKKKNKLFLGIAVDTRH